MARSDAVWGIDIGQSALKALRCRPHDDKQRLVADAFDYVEYPRILSQPEADPVQLVKDAINEFLSRNKVRGDRVAVSVPGQSGLARFIKLPPVESKKIPDIVKYEARQQIPFPLEDVVWDYQQMPGGSEADGFVLETEVGLFAMKRDQVYRALKPFTEAGIEVDLLQLTPLALFNMIVFDQMPELPPPEAYNPDDPPPSVVLLSMGTDTTDLVVTNGYRVWQRSIPLGGNHFTKALTKELKLTFAKAEQTKRNAAAHENPKALFQAMRPVFTDLATEMDRSLKFFGTIDRTAKIGKIYGLGNVLKLPGLQRFIQQNIGIEVVKLDQFAQLEGPGIVDAPAFKQNLLAFSTAYGLCIQALRDPKIRTNLIPREILQDRLIRSKKPWAVAAAAALLLGMTGSYLGAWRQYSSANPVDFQSAMAEADRVAGDAGRFKSDFDSSKSGFTATKDLGRQLIIDPDARTNWLKVVRAVNAALPRDELPRDGGEQPEKIGDRNQLQIVSVDCAQYDDLAAWFSSPSIGKAWQDMQDLEKQFAPKASAPATTPVVDPNNPETAATDGTAASTDGAPPDGAPPDGASTDPAAAGDGAASGPTGPGWVFTLRGYHYHNLTSKPDDSKEAYVIKTLIENLRQKEIDTPEGKVPVGDLGIGYPVIIHNGRLEPATLTNALGEPVDPKTQNVDGMFQFIVKFTWQPPTKEGAAPADATATAGL